MDKKQSSHQVNQSNKRLLPEHRWLSNKKILIPGLAAGNVLLFFALNYLFNLILQISNLGSKAPVPFSPGIGNAFQFDFSRYWIFYLVVLLFLLFFNIRLLYRIRVNLKDYNINQKGSERWTTLKEIQEQYKEIPEKSTAFSGLGGIPVCRYGDKIYIDDGPVNNLIIGMTRSGKGETYVFPMLDIYSRAEEKPSLIITDPKLELAAASFETLKERGFEVHILNLIEPVHSMGYNPLRLIIDAYKRKDYSEAELLCRTFAYAIFNPNVSTGGNDKFFSANASAALCAAILAHIDDCLTADQQTNEEKEKQFFEGKKYFESLSAEEQQNEWFRSVLSREKEAHPEYRKASEAVVQAEQRLREWELAHQDSLLSLPDRAPDEQGIAGYEKEAADLKDKYEEIRQKIQQKEEAGERINSILQKEKEKRREALEEKNRILQLIEEQKKKWGLRQELEQERDAFILEIKKSRSQLTALQESVSRTLDIPLFITEADWDEVYEKKATFPDETFSPTRENEKKITMYSIINTFMTLAGMWIDEKTTMLDIYFQERPELDRAKMKYASIRVAGDRTKTSIFSSMLTELEIFTYEEVAKMTAESTFALKDVGFGEKPIAIFLGLPDFDSSIHFIASLFIRQLYFVLAKNATLHPSGRCTREVVYLLDEFGNIPAIEGMANIITVCLGRNIRFNLIIQAYAQLQKLYGDDTETILGNCGNKIYIKTDSLETAKEFSESLGNETVVNVNRSGKVLSMDKQITEMYEEKPLLNPNELMRLQQTECVVKRTMKQQDLKGNLIVAYPIFNTGKTAFKYRHQYLLDAFPSGKLLSSLPIENTDGIKIQERVFDVKQYLESWQKNLERKRLNETPVSTLRNFNNLCEIFRKQGFDVPAFSSWTVGDLLEEMERRYHEGAYDFDRYCQLLNLVMQGVSKD